jgi:hypothetical protein
MSSRQADERRRGEELSLGRAAMGPREQEFQRALDGYIAAYRKRHADQRGHAAANDSDALSAMRNPLAMPLRIFSKYTRWVGSMVSKPLGLALQGACRVLASAGVNDGPKGAKGATPPSP